MRAFLNISVFLFFGFFLDFDETNVVHWNIAIGLRRRRKHDSLASKSNDVFHSDRAQNPNFLDRISAVGKKKIKK